LDSEGFVVKAIDLEQNPYAKNLVYNVISYDGKNIPFPDEYFDVVFSSNVLEHIAHIDQFLLEMKRVLKSNGIAIHILPTGSWRFWTNMSHYLYIIKAMLLMVHPKLQDKDRLFESAIKRTHEYSKAKIIRKIVLPSRHGELVNFIEEIYYFSRFHWISLFQKTGWTIKSCRPNKLFYTGYSVLGSLLKKKIRHIMSYLLGSSCLIYYITKKSS